MKTKKNKDFFFWKIAVAAAFPAFFKIFPKFSSAVNYRNLPW